MSSSTSASSTVLHQKMVPAAYLVILSGFWMYTGITTNNFSNWLAESSLFVSTIIILIAFYRHFRFSLVAYSCFFVFLFLHLHGAHYSYPKAPAGFWIQEMLHLNRNPYDRLVHFGFGLLMVLPMYELAKGPLTLKKHMRWWWPLELVLALSIVYELAEWLVAAVIFPNLGTSYLGYQGDMWDAQKDVSAAFAGAVIALVFIRILRR